MDRIWKYLIGKKKRKDKVHSRIYLEFYKLKSIYKCSFRILSMKVSKRVRRNNWE